MSTPVKLALENLFQRFQQHQSSVYLGRCEYEEDWLSPCLVGEVENGTSAWNPALRSQKQDLSNISQALDIELHPSISDYFCSFYSGSIDCLYEQDGLSLIQAWNEDDFDLLQQNIIGHLLMKKKLKQQATVFIAATTDDMYVISVLNSSGEVVLEPVGKEPVQLLAPSIAEFLALLNPAS
ncbi:SecY-interacting protein [Catenovulum maritimum]|uniref:Protein Syd n=1 Tax=Catenovulum maritimum TaxID=1513271 RepID=A0A0J8JM70_9ALTE|nr:SecY-interacting protein [Catenovulum maritimum]KMT65681.1 hypothetical protein XM47_08285 [Catenovulum maritimum]